MPKRKTRKQMKVSGKRKTAKRTSGKKKPNAWNNFVKKIFAREKPNGKTFKECLVIASKEKKQGKMNA